MCAVCTHVCMYIYVLQNELPFYHTIQTGSPVRPSINAEEEEESDEESPLLQSSLLRKNVATITGHNGREREAEYSTDSMDYKCEFVNDVQREMVSVRKDKIYEGPCSKGGVALVERGVAL